MRSYLVEMRKSKSETQQNVADAIGISRQYYDLIERGERQKRMDVLLAAALANHFGVSAMEILEKEQELASKKE